MRNRLFILIKENLYLSDMWLDVTPRMDTERTCILKEIELHAQKYDNHSKLSNHHNWGEMYTTT
jgi:hypothetical protein